MDLGANSSDLEKKKTNKFVENQISLGLTFDDVLLLPQYSDINSRKDVKLKTKFSRNITLSIPLVSSPMDTVTEVEMAIGMARNGGLGIIHRFQSIEDQANMVMKVKRSETNLISDPVTVSKETTIKTVRELSKLHNIGTFLVIDDNMEVKRLGEGVKNMSLWPRKRSEIRNVLCGIITKRDIKFCKDESETVGKLMTTRDKMTVWEKDYVQQMPDISVLKDVMLEKRIEKLPIVTPKNEILGLVTLKDIMRLYEEDYNPNLDSQGSLVVGAAIGAKDDFLERATALVDAGCDVLVVDIANGHSKLCIDTVKILKQQFPETDIVAGSVATGEGALNLIKAGADGIRCGIGNGSICITRIVSGCGVPQLSALFDVAPVCKEYGIPLISDGGNRNSGNMCKALAAGADCIMLGRLVAGCEESPSKVVYRDGKLCKVYRGMAGYGANVSKAQRLGDQEPSNKTFTPEGVEGYIPYAGPLKDVLNQFCAGIKSGMSYSGARVIEELQEKAKFIRITSSGKHESGVHDITKI